MNQNLVFVRLTLRRSLYSRPENMVGFRLPPGKGLYIHPGTWHNGIYVNRKYTPLTVFTRQGKVHARVSASWVSEFDTLLKLPLPLD